MLLATQVQALLYHFLIGWCYGLTYSFIAYFSESLKKTFIKFIVEAIFHICFVIIAFYGLYKINGSITNVYFITCFFIGIYLYFKFYYATFLIFYQYVNQRLKPLKLAKNKINGIIKTTGSHFIRRNKSHGKEKTSKKEDQIRDSS